MAFTSEGLRVIGIGSLLRDKPLTVPTYQRSYAWEDEDVEDYWDDIIRAMRSPNDDYFVGSVVLSQTPGDTQEVVDGQQRLATTAIIIGAIRDYFLEHDDGDRADDIQGRYLVPKNLFSNG